MDIINAFTNLGITLGAYVHRQLSNKDLNDFLDNQIQQAEIKNPWFTRENILFSIAHWSSLLTEESLKKWSSAYSKDDNSSQKTVAIIMAGNIPLVGFHDLLCVLYSGNRALVKLSSKDDVLPKALAEIMFSFAPNLREKICFEKEKLTNYQAAITTGSNNSARYFEYYFRDIPHIIRKSRTSVAIINGRETKEELSLLSNDIFTYFGLGCRSVNKLFVPKGYDFQKFWKAIDKYNKIKNHHKYFNNYSYYRSIYLMNKISFYENDFVILREEKSLSSPISVINYQEYTSLTELEKIVTPQHENLQCIVAAKTFQLKGSICFGASQYPQLTDYADDIDTMQFLGQL